MKGGRPFPDHTHEILGTYLKERLERDEEKLKRKFNLNVKDVRGAAEKIAFCMTAESNIGLNPTRKEILIATEKLQLFLGRDFNALLNALEYLKLARSDNNGSSEDAKTFTFSHRRFQEYFATCVVLNEPDRVTPLQLLTNARWRETAVVLCQTQPRGTLQPIIQEAESLLVSMNQEVNGLIDQPVKYLDARVKGEDLFPFQHHTDELFRWPKNAVSLLDLLQDAFHKNIESLDVNVRDAAGKLVFTATMRGLLVDRKIALEVGGIAPQILLEWMLRLGFLDKSQWLKDVAYDQVAKLTEIPPDIARCICEALVKLLTKENPRRELLTARVHVARLDKSSHFLSINKVLRIAVSIKFLLGHYAVALAAIIVMYSALWEEGFWGERKDPTSWAFGFLVVFSFGISPYITRFALQSDDPLNSMFLYLKPLMIVFMTYWLANVYGDLSIYDHCVMTGFIYTIFWPSTARWLAYKGKFLHPLIWPILPLVAVSYLPGMVLNKVITNRRRAREWVRANWRKVLKVSMFVTRTTAGLMIFPVAAFWFVGKGEKGKLLSGLLMLSLVIIMVTIMIRSERRMTENRRRDKREWKTKVKQLKNQMVGQEFCSYLYSFKTIEYRTRVVEHTRSNDLLIANKDSEDLLTLIARDVENAVNASENSRIFSEDYLDEISKLIEKIRLARKDI